MNGQPAARAVSLSLDELIALNREIASLVRAGVPLEEGLAELGPDLPGRLGEYTIALAERTARGESLVQVIADNALGLPAAYRAVIEAGMRAERLPAALESVADEASRLAEIRHTTLLVFFYPALILLVAWCGILYFTCILAPHLANMFRAFDVPGREFLDAMAEAGRYAGYWGPILPVVLVLLFLLGRRSAGSFHRRTFLGGEPFWNRLPWVGRMLQYTHTATFLDILALLVEHRTPLPEAILLAAESTGDPKTTRSARRLADAVQQGQMPHDVGIAFPPLTRWLLASAGREEALLPALRHAASASRRRARQQADMFRLFMPIGITVVIGGGVTCVYALMLFLPYISLLYHLGG